MADGYATDAEFYDRIHADREADIGLWQAFAARTDRPVLEVGTGTGRISVALALAGATVSAIDPSPAMLARARGRAEQRGADVAFFQGTADQVALEPDHYGFVLIPADVFLYCGDGEQQLATLRALAACMTFNGLLALDLPGPAMALDPATNGQPQLVFSGAGEDGDAFDAWHVHEDDLGAQSRWLRVIYEWVAADAVVRRRTSEHHLRYVYRFEAEYLLRLAGLAVADVYGDYDIGPLTNDSERMIITARRLRG
ncbi:MAG: methyltransferase domain-containing protein [Chloroflexi bacterium]|nr:methyltransferase domain-containing protein [Chloroflexota bacterium]